MIFHVGDLVKSIDDTLRFELLQLIIFNEAQRFSLWLVRILETFPSSLAGRLLKGKNIIFYVQCSISYSGCWAFVLFFSICLFTLLKACLVE